jgi:fucose 4-O-acetylase-like acetyltransferase
MTLTAQRDYFFDNAKFILILLVVIGHAIEPLIAKNHFLHSVYLFIYLFHMPLFILIGGYFTKKKKNLGKLLLKFLIPYLIFELLYAPLFIGQYQFLVTPYWVLWFMLSYICWNLMLPLFTKLKHPIILSIIIAIGAGYISSLGLFLSISRTLYFFPFFILGHYLTKQHIEWIFAHVKKAYSIAILSLTFMILLFFDLDIIQKWLYGVDSYRELGNPEWYAGIYRLGLFGITAILSIAFLSLIPRKKTWYSELGSRTLYVYLLHVFVIKLISMLHIYQFIVNPLEVILLILFSILVTIFLSSKGVKNVTQYFIEPRLDFIKLQKLH